MAIDQHKFQTKHKTILRDTRPFFTRVADGIETPGFSTAMFAMLGGAYWVSDWFVAFGDLVFIFGLLYFWFLTGRSRALAFKLPMNAKYKDPNNDAPGKNEKPEGILYLGNVDEKGDEVWFTNSDARTHILYLGTTGAGKTEGLKSMVTNAMTWGSGFVYVDGKADTDLWSSLSSLVRRFGRDDDLLVLNYMTGNSDVSAPSNTMNPFSSGSASYLVNMLVELMPDAEGDNAMWKERAVSLASAMMPVLTYKRDFQDVPLSVRSIRDNLSLNNVVKLQRDETVPGELRSGLRGYLDTLPGFIDDAYDDNGQIKPPSAGQPQHDTTTANQQHGYLAMQFTRALQSLGDDYGYIFDTQAADVDMLDVVLNRRILVVLIPALEKSGDEIANLGKIVAATLKGMMGSTLGSTVEGSSETVIENKPTHSATPFMTVFDEVGYYTAQGMAVMAAQARSLGFCLVFSGQDLPAMKKRVREEANSITANCNIKIFGKLEDPTETKEFFEKTVGQVFVTEVSGYQMMGGAEFKSYFDTQQASVQARAVASYEELRTYKEGQAIITFGMQISSCRIFYSNPGFAKAMRVTRFLALPPPDEQVIKHAAAITELRDLMVDKNWTAEKADVAVDTPPEIEALIEGYRIAETATENKVDRGIASVVQVHGVENNLDEAIASAPPVKKPAASKPAAAPAPEASPAAQVAQQTEAPKANEPEAKPETPSQAPPADKNQESGAGPMGFFGSKDKKAKKPERSAASDKSQDKSWEDIIKAAKDNEVLKEEQGAQDGGEAIPAQQVPPESAAQPEQTQAAKPAQKKLPDEIENIIKEAAKKSGDNLFNKGSEDIDAAE